MILLLHRYLLTYEQRIQRYYNTYILYVLISYTIPIHTHYNTHLYTDGTNNKIITKRNFVTTSLHDLD